MVSISNLQFVGILVFLVILFCFCFFFSFTWLRTQIFFICLAFSNITIGNQGIIADKNSSCYGIIGGIIWAHAGGGGGGS